MEEKKLTDEELIDCLYECEKLRGCNGCKLKNSQECGDLIIGAIHRLQSKIAEYEQKLEDGELVSKDWHDEQVGHAELVIEEQKLEIERLTEENGQLKGYNNGLEYENNELQKQVDELTKYKKFVDACKLGGDIEIVMNRVKPYAVLREKLYQQTVKETAKEIFTKIDNAFSLYYPHGQIPYSVFQETLKRLAKQKGVEVE